MSDEKQAAKKADEKQAPKKVADGVMTPEKAKSLGLDPFPYGGK